MLFLSDPRAAELKPHCILANVNAGEDALPETAAGSIYDRFFKTSTGHSIYGLLET